MKRVLIILFIIIIIISLSSIFLKYDKFSIIDISECINKECDKIFKFNSNTLTIKNDINNNYSIKINNKKTIVGTYGFPKLGNNIYTFDGLIMIEQSIDEYVKVLLFYDVNGEEKNISELEENSKLFLNSYQVKDIKDKKGNIKDIEIILYGTRFVNDDTFYFGIDDGDVAKLDSCEAYEKNKEKIVTSTYKIKYIGNNKFSEIEKISETKLEDYKEKDFSILCNE